MREDREMLRQQFEKAARQHGNLEPGACFAALAASVDGVPAELLDAYVEMFQDLEDGKTDSSLMESIHRGLWSPASATEYLQRYIAFASGTQPFRYG
jgi:hypothetical protein